MMGAFWEKYLVMIMTAALGTVGYCLNVNIKRNKILYGCIGGVLSTFLYCVFAEAGLSLLMQNLIPAAVVTFYAEVLARMVKAPATVFLIPSITGSFPWFRAESCITRCARSWTARGVMPRYSRWRRSSSRLGSRQGSWRCRWCFTIPATKKCNSRCGLMRGRTRHLTAKPGQTSSRCHMSAKIFRLALLERVVSGGAFPV